MYKVGMSVITVASQNLFKNAPVQKRSLWHWVNVIFNRVDEDRRKIVGPDRSCAEWILRNGGAVKWATEKEFLRDYNKLPNEEVKFKLVEIDASESSISHYGFAHFIDCTSIRKIKLHKCTYVEDIALKQLVHLKNCLLHLQVSSCPNITDTGLLYLTELQKLSTLLISDLPYVKDKNHVEKTLKEAMPKCNVEYK